MTRHAKPGFVLKLGGELLEHPNDLQRVAAGIVDHARAPSSP